MVPMVIEGTPKTPQLLAMQVKKGLKKQMTSLATHKEEKQDAPGEPMLEAIEGVLNELKDVMSPELLDKFPSRREDDYKIELESRAKPLAMGPYKMAPPEVEELRKQLKELSNTIILTSIFKETCLQQITPTSTRCKL